MQRLLITLGAIFMLAACGPKEIGAECQGGVSRNDCVDGLICTLARSPSTPPPEDPNGERSYCRTICDVDGVCEPGFECRQVVGSMTRSCQPTDGPAPTGDGGP